MKRVVSIMLALFLFCISITAAEDAVFTHPEAGYGFTMPEGWEAADQQSVSDYFLTAPEGEDFLLLIRQIIEAAEDLQFIILCEAEEGQPMFHVVISIISQDLEVETDISELILYYADTVDETYMSMFPEYTVLQHMAPQDIGAWSAAVSGGDFQIDDLSYSIREVWLISGTELYEISLMTSTELLDSYEDILYQIAETFFPPEMR